MHLGSAAIHHGYLIRALGMVMPGRPQLCGSGPLLAAFAARRLTKKTLEGERLVCRSGQGGGGRPLGKSPPAPRCEHSARKRSTKLSQPSLFLVKILRRLSHCYCSHNRFGRSPN
jgi:hypothetical protein